MENMDLKNINTTAKFSNFQVLNPDFVRCKCNVFYTGENRNYSNITDEALRKFIERKGYANVPVIGHIRASKKNGKPIMGSHDRKIEITDDGIKEINECTAYGVIPLDANPRMEKITDIHGVEREYFTVDIILWTHYFPELMETVYSDEIYFNQSMEIKLLDSYVDNRQYTVINDFSLQALCMLGKYDGSHGNGDVEDNSEPCFEDSTISRFSLNEDKFRQNFELMLETLKQYETGETPVQNNNPTKKEENTTMDYAKIVEKLSAFTYENVLGETVSKYSLIDVMENSIGVVDREDNKVYSFDCVESDGEIVIDTDSKTECSMTYKAMSETGNFDYAGEITLAQTTAQTVKETELSKSFSEEYDSKINEITETYTQLKADYDAMVVEYNKYKAADEARLEKEKHTQIDAVVEKYAKKIGRLPKFLCYRAKIDYTKDVADIENELILMAGEAMMDNSKQNFSYTPSVCPVSGTPADKLTHNDRYGNLFDKFIND